MSNGLSKRKYVNEQLEDCGYTAQLAEGFDDAIIGIGSQMGHTKTVVIYSQTKIIKCLMKDMSAADAIEYFEFNTLGAYVGDTTPIYVDDSVLEDVPEESTEGESND
jgi:hypothetical protein|tara:strand:+ start:3081 stop:3401 length:321 start_codon:yes stop_codon:yes gene_type:complete